MVEEVTYAIYIVDCAWPDGDRTGDDTYLMTCDFEANGGRGFLTVTTDQRCAKRFSSGREALEYWRTQSKTVPLRPDGKPNRPLTAYTIEIKQVE